MNNQLELLVEMGRHFAATQDIEETLARALARIAELIEAEGGALFILEPSPTAEAGTDAVDQLVCHASFGPVDIKGLTVPAHSGIVGRSVTHNRSEIVRDTQSDVSFDTSMDAQSGFITRSILCAPLSVKDERIGAIEVVNKIGGAGLFADDDLTLLEALATSAALAISNARMAGELAEKEVMRRELELAAEIQRGLLPTRDATGAVPICGVNRPARVVSGDFFDYFTLYDGRIAFTLADVSGKGMNAALLMAKTASLFRCLGKGDLRPGRLLQRINAEVCETALRGMFVTMVAGIYDPLSGRVVLANAGHEPPLLHATDGTFTGVPASAPPVGIPPELTGGGPVPEQVLHLNGGTLYVFTDGATEGYVAPGEELGTDGFQDMIRCGVADGLAAQARIDRIADSLSGSGEVLRDDITVLAIDDAQALQKRRDRGDNVSVENNPGREACGKPKQGQPETAVVSNGSMCALSVPARASSLKLVRRAVGETAAACGFGQEQCQDVMLAVDEACQNVVRHAYPDTTEGDMVVDIRCERGSYIVLIRDFAAPVDVALITGRDLDDVRPGGLGVHFIREIMDSVEYMSPPDGHGNLLRLKKAI